MEDLIICKKLETLLNRVYPSLKNYPKAEKFCICEDIRWEFLNGISELQSANSVKSKRVYHLQMADKHIRNLQILFRLSNNQKYIGKEFFREIDLELSNIASMNSNWIKKSAKKSK